MLLKFTEVCRVFLVVGCDGCCWLRPIAVPSCSIVSPHRVILGHDDYWLPGFSRPTDTTPIRAAIAATSPDVELLEPGYLAGTQLFAGLTNARVEAK